MSAMRAVTSNPLQRTRSAGPEKSSNVDGLTSSFAAAGVELNTLFGWEKVAFRRVESVSVQRVAVEVGGRTVELPRSLVPTAQREQWLRFERNSGHVTVQVDLSATLRGEARLADLFLQLGAAAR